MVVLKFCRNNSINELYSTPKKWGKFVDRLLSELRAVEGMRTHVPHPEPAEGPELSDRVIDDPTRGLTTYNSRLTTKKLRKKCAKIILLSYVY